MPLSCICGSHNLTIIDSADYGNGEFDEQYECEECEETGWNKHRKKNGRIEQTVTGCLSK
jgi:hypothetical protein